MIKAGICSVTLAKCSAEEVVATAVQGGLQGIEWWGAGHVPHGDVACARRVRWLTASAGLEVSSYGSYYRVGVSEGAGLSFQSVLDTAVALGAPTIRVWAGDRDTCNADAAFIQKVIDDTNRIAGLAAEQGISITFEFHGGSLTDRNETAIRFAAQVPHSNVFFSWQSPHGYTMDHCLEGLWGLLSRLSTVHVYHWTIGSYEQNTANETIRPLKYPEDFYRHPLADGTERWKEYLAAVRSTGRDHFALLEFVKDDSSEQVVADARTLSTLVNKTGCDSNGLKKEKI
ncbi:MAG: TIM barrel protein [Kiritimatiellales bacterium]